MTTATRITSILLLLCIALPAQIVQFANRSDVAFEGWARCTVDVMPPNRIGYVDTERGDRFVFWLGRETGLDTRAIDVRVHLEAGESVALDLGKSKPLALEREAATQLTKWMGGIVSIGGNRLTRVQLDADGAGYLCHWRGRVGRMLFADLWVHWVPGQGWARGEVLLTCSNPSIPDMGEDAPDDLTLKVGDAVVLVPGRPAGAPLIDADTWFDDAQARALPLVLAWPKWLKKSGDWAAVGVVANLGLGACGIRQLLVQGNPRLPANLDAQAWTGQRLAESIRRLHSWEAPLLGPNRRSQDTGAQSDQTFVAGEVFAKNGVGAERVAYLAALKMAGRPCHHLELDGEQVDILRHLEPRLVYWNSRPHIPAVSPDQLGKPRGLGETIWAGADVEHWFHNNLAAAVRLTGSPCLQHLLSAQARVYMLQHTTRSDLPYQSVPFAARAWGWEAIMAVHLYRELEDRALAARVRLHWLDRANKVLIPQLTGPNGEPVLDWRRDDRIGPGLRYMPWQHGVGAYGLDLAGEVFGHDGARQLARAFAKRVFADTWWKTSDRWTSRDVVAQDGAAVPSGAYDFFGSPLIVATMLRLEPTHEQAREIWKQLLLEATEPQQVSWMAPAVR